MRQLRDEEDPRAEAMRARADEVAETLEGTARDLNDESTEEERNNADFCERLDSLIFECAECSWWCELVEQNSCGRCNDCCDHPQDVNGECEEDEDDEDEDEEDDDDQRGYN